jgi:imidazolonepropionase-like amidohydrolase
MRFVMMALVGLAGTAEAQRPEAPPAELVVRAGHLLDVRTGQWITDATILIRGDRITSVGSAAAAPAGLRVVDLSGLWVLPGLIDAHIHINDEPQLRGAEYHTASAARLAILGVKNARKTVMAGFTSARSLGGNHFADVAVRDAINAGEIVGPRLQVSGPMVGGTGSHCDYSFLAPEFKYNDEGVADGADALVGKTREGFKYGADWVKFCASGGVSSRLALPDDVHQSPEEMNAIVAEAHRRRKKAAAHAHGTEAIKLAVLAGVESIEHGSMLDDEAIALMKQRGTYLVADLYNGDWIIANGAANNFSAASLAKARMLNPVQRESFRKAVAAGVKVAFGTDAGTMPHGLQARQFALYAQYGLTPLQAIQSATIWAADLLGWSDRVATLEAGKFADLVAVREDPLGNLDALTVVAFVMKGGEVVVPRREQSPR